jgi:hypothetical protein
MSDILKPEHDLTLVLYSDSIKENKHEQDLLDSAMSGDRIIELIGNNYTVVEITKESYSKHGYMPGFTRPDSTRYIIKAMKIIPRQFDEEMGDHYNNLCRKVFG